MDIRKIKTAGGDYFYPETATEAVQAKPSGVNKEVSKPLDVMLDFNIGWATTRIKNGKYYLYLFRTKEDYDIWKSCDGLTEEEIYSKGYSPEDVDKLVVLKLLTGEASSNSSSENPNDDSEEDLNVIDYKLVLPINEAVGGGGNVFVPGETIPITLSNYDWIGDMKINMRPRKGASNLLYYILQVSYDGKNIEDTTKTWVDLAEHDSFSITDPETNARYTIEESKGNEWLPEEVLTKIKNGERFNIYLRVRTDDAAQALHKLGALNRETISIESYITPNTYITGDTETRKDSQTFTFDPYISVRQETGPAKAQLAETTHVYTYLRNAILTSANEYKYRMNNLDKYVLPLHFKGVNCKDDQMRISFNQTKNPDIQNKFQYWVEGDEDHTHTINLLLTNTSSNSISGDGDSTGFNVSKEQARNGIHIYIEPRKKADGTYDFPKTSGEFTFDFWGESAYYPGTIAGSASTVRWDYFVNDGFINVSPIYKVDNVNVDTLILEDKQTENGNPVNPPYWDKYLKLLFRADEDHTNSAINSTYSQYPFSGDPHVSYFYLTGSNLLEGVSLKTLREDLFTVEYWNNNYNTAYINGNSWKTCATDGNPNTELQSLINNYGKVLIRVKCEILGDVAVNSTDLISDYADLRYYLWITSGAYKTQIELLYRKTVNWVYGKLSDTDVALPKASLACNNNNSFYEWLCRKSSDLGIDANIEDGYILRQELNKIKTLPRGFMKDVKEDSEGNPFTTITKEALNYIPNLSIIKDRAFANCSNLSSVTLSDNIQSISNNAFNNCSEDLQIMATDPSIVNTNYEVIESNY